MKEFKRETKEEKQMKKVSNVNLPLTRDMVLLKRVSQHETDPNPLVVRLLVFP